MKRRTALGVMAVTAAAVAAGDRLVFAAEDAGKQLETIIKQDHEQVKKLFEQLTQQNVPGDKRQLVFQQLRQAILPHMDAEEQSLYPAMESKKDIRLDALTAEEEHKAAKSLLADMEKTQPGDERFLAKAKVLKESVEHHIKEEESKILPEARKALSAQEMQQVLDGFKARKQQGMEGMKG